MYVAVIIVIIFFGLPYTDVKSTMLTPCKTCCALTRPYPARHFGVKMYTKIESPDGGNSRRAFCGGAFRVTPCSQSPAKQKSTGKLMEWDSNPVISSRCLYLQCNYYIYVVVIKNACPIQEVSMMKHLDTTWSN